MQNKGSYRIYIRSKPKPGQLLPDLWQWEASFRREDHAREHVRKLENDKNIEINMKEPRK